MKMYAYPQVNMPDSFTRGKKTFVAPSGDPELPKVVVTPAFVGPNQLPSRKGD